LDIIGEIFPHSSKQHRYILTVTDYFTWWIEAVPLKQSELLGGHQLPPTEHHLILWGFGIAFFL